MANIKHIEMPCTYITGIEQKCKYKGFVQVVIVDDPKTQKKIDALANKKLADELYKQHEDGLHDGR